MAGRKTKYTPRAPRPTDDEITRRVADVYVLLLNGTPRRHILQHVANKWGVKTRQADEYIARASAEFESLSATIYEQEHGKSLARLDDLYYRAITKGDLQRALEAQRERNKVVGLYAPARTDITSGGQAIKGYIGISPDDWDKRDKTQADDE